MMRVIHVLPLLSQVGCMIGFADGGGQDGDDGRNGCQAIRTDLEFGERSSLGFSAGDVLEMMDTDTDSPMYYKDMSVTEATFPIEIDITSAHHLELRGTADRCGDEAVVFDGALVLETTDGQFSEFVRGQVWAESGDAASFQADLLADFLVGRHTPDPAETDGWKRIRYHFELEFDEEGTRGLIRWSGTQYRGGIIYYKSIDVAAWNGSEDSPW